MSNQAATGFSIQYGTSSIVVEDTSKPTWFGDYHGGKLAIYTAQFDDPTFVDSITMVCIFYDADDNDFVMSCHYLASCSLDEIISDLQARVIIKYAQEKSRAKQQQQPSIYVPGPDTLQ